MAKPSTNKLKKIEKVPSLSIKTIIALTLEEYGKNQKASASSQNAGDKHLANFWAGALWALQQLLIRYEDEIDMIDAKSYNIWIKGFIWGITLTLILLGTLTFIFN